MSSSQSHKLKRHLQENWEQIKSKLMAVKCKPSRPSYSENLKAFSVNRESLICIKDKIPIDDKEAIDEQVNLKMPIKQLRHVVHKVLYGRERTVITMRYGLDPKMAEMTQREIAGELNISRSYVSRIEKKALTKLRREFIETKQS